ncbi:MAG: Xaa-Pro dipeptidase [Wenzhouxiangella sp.]|nr:Xaa-Pro dipeptidase [Wenzhouxiangella sp.]TVR97429.1 MAG: Xaa-Pro dipeptidase [Wenzhouxiangellaceae bacterium]
MPSSHKLLFARHVEDRLASTRALLGELGYDSLLIHSGRAEFRLFDDQAPPFRAHAAFASWLPLPFAEDCLLEIRVADRPRLWFLQPRDYWHLPPSPPADWWQDAFDIELVEEREQWAECFDRSRALAVIGRRRDLAEQLGGAELNPSALIAGMAEARTVKTGWERECMARANDIAARAHLAAADVFESGGSELEIHLAYLAAAGQDQDQLPYNSIVALNEHASVLHYQHRSARRPSSARSFLIDAGADFCGYAADVTRTWTMPENRDFDDLLDAMERVQQGLCKQITAGISFVDLHRQAHLDIAAVLEQAELVRMSPEEMVESGVSSYFFPHGLGHFIGAQVHDVAGKVDSDGQPLPPPERYPFLRLTRRLEPGNVLTVEPGLYFIPILLEQLKASAFADRVNWSQVEGLVPLGGIRIEDNVLVTEAEPVNFTRQSFNRIQD